MRFRCTSKAGRLGGEDGTKLQYVRLIQRVRSCIVNQNRGDWEDDMEPFSAFIEEI